MVAHEPAVDAVRDIVANIEGHTTGSSNIQGYQQSARDVDIPDPEMAELNSQQRDTEPYDEEEGDHHTQYHIGGNNNQSQTTSRKRRLPHTKTEADRSHSQVTAVQEEATPHLREERAEKPREDEDAGRPQARRLLLHRHPLTKSKRGGKSQRTLKKIETLHHKVEERCLSMGDKEGDGGTHQKSFAEIRKG